MGSQLIHLAFTLPPPHIGRIVRSAGLLICGDDPSQPQAQNQAVRRLPLFAAPKVPFDLRSIRCATDAMRRGHLSISARLFSRRRSFVSQPLCTSCLITMRPGRTGSRSNMVGGAAFLRMSLCS